MQIFADREKTLAQRSNCAFSPNRGANDHNVTPAPASGTLGWKEYFYFYMQPNQHHTTTFPVVQIAFPYCDPRLNDDPDETTYDPQQFHRREWRYGRFGPPARSSPSRIDGLTWPMAINWWQYFLCWLIRS